MLNGGGEPGVKMGEEPGGELEECVGDGGVIGLLLLIVDLSRVTGEVVLIDDPSREVVGEMMATVEEDTVKNS